MSNFQFHNHVTMERWALPELVRAREDGDLDKVAVIEQRIRKPDGSVDMSGFERVSKIKANNVNVLQGKKAALDLITGVLANAGKVWYIAPYESDSTPDLSWDGDFGAGTVTEFIQYSGDDPVGGRQACNFTAATGTVSRVDATNPVMAVMTIDAGVVDRSLYGVCVTDNSTKQYGGGAAILLAGVRYPSPEIVNAAEVIYLKYGIYIP